MPAYNENWIFCIFFIIFLIVHLFIFTNIILATIIQNYKTHLRDDIKWTIKIKREQTNEAFDYLKDNLFELIQNNPTMYKFEITEYIKSPSVPVLTYSKFNALLRRIYPKMPEDQFKNLFHILDSDGNNLLTFKEFVYLPELLKYQATERDKIILFESYFPRFYNSTFSNIIKHLVNHWYEEISFV
jgi:hypothetical protein